MSEKKVLIAMSGGVDSSAAALLMKEQGFTCIGCTMKLFSNDTVCNTKSRTCCSFSDIQDARSVAFQLDIPYYVFNFTADFVHQVIEPFISSYQRGMTPNPCIDCNRHLKFDALLHRAAQLDYEYVATGHYARIEYNEKAARYLLKKGLDESKDQSYVLYAMTQYQLSHTLFPLGLMKKTDVRNIAERSGFINARKKDSQDICFVPDGDYASFIEKYTGITAKPGSFVSVDNKVLGTHKGIIHYTIGQRRGIGLSYGEPMYVGGVDPENNTVTLCKDEQLYTSVCYAENCNWISFDVPDDFPLPEISSLPYMFQYETYTDLPWGSFYTGRTGENAVTEPFRAVVKIRYRHDGAEAAVIPLPGKKAAILFKTPQRSPTPGQAAVFYDGDFVLGGGTLCVPYYSGRTRLHGV